MASEPTWPVKEGTWEEADLAHIVHPASKWREVLDGTKTKVKALCGTFVRHAVPARAPVCRECFDEQMKRDIATAKELETAAVK